MALISGKCLNRQGCVVETFLAVFNARMGKDVTLTKEEFIRLRDLFNDMDLQE